MRPTRPVGAAPPGRHVLAVVVDVPAGATGAFRRYEDLVLPLLPRHGGRLERRLRSEDGLTEVHVLSFADEAGSAGYLADPQRQAHREVLTGVDVTSRLLVVADVPGSEVAVAGDFLDDFDGGELDRQVWVPHYLPQWSSRAASAATYAVAGSELTLTVPPEQGLWCAGDHLPALRVSGVQSGVFSGPVGSTVGQQPYRDGLVVREEQPAHWGWTPRYGRLEVRARMELSRRSMASAWLVGLEDRPERCGEICVFEVFGDAVEPGRSAAVGGGVHPFRDPLLTEDFAAPRLALDVREHHAYAVEWQRGRLDLFVDGTHVRTVSQAPDYPVQLVLAVFDFPGSAHAAACAGHVPALVVDAVRGS